jgi:tetratricopeptide (TPR) repeat protein
MDPSFVMAHWRLGEVYEQMGRYQEADAEFRYGHNRADVIYLSILSGRHRGAIKNLGDLSARHPYYVALIYAALGDKDRAFRYLYEAHRMHEAPMVLLKAEPKLDSLRSDARYRDLLIKMKLPY